MSFLKNISGKRLLLSTVLGIFTISLMLLFLFLIINGGNSNSKPHNIDLKTYTYYAVSLGKYDNLERAKVEADKVIVRGGAGYIAEFKGFNVLAALYISKPDAESVIKSLKASDIEAEIFMIEIPKIYVKSEFDYSDSLNALFDTLEKLCGLYYKIDNRLFNLAKALEELNIVIEGLNQSLKIIEKQEKSITGVRIKAEFKIAINYLSNLLTYENADVLSLKIKQTQFKIVFGAIDLFYEIADY